MNHRNMKRRLRPARSERSTARPGANGSMLDFAGSRAGHYHSTGLVNVVVNSERKPLGQRSMETSKGLGVTSRKQPQRFNIGSQAINKVSAEPLLLSLVEPKPCLQISLRRWQNCYFKHASQGGSRRPRRATPAWPHPMAWPLPGSVPDAAWPAPGRAMLG